MDASALPLPIPVVTIFVRHSDHCKGRDGKERDESYKSCKCPKHLRWSFAGKQFRLSAKTRVWSVAERKRREIEAQFQTDPAQASFVRKSEAKPTIERAIELFLIGKRSEGVGASVSGKYKRELGRLEDFMAKRSRFFPHEISLEDLTEYRADWTETYPTPTTRARVQSRLRCFLTFCFDARMLDRIPKLSAIKADQPQAMPLSELEYRNLLAAVHSTFGEGTRKTRRVHALIRFQRYCGLSLCDVVALKRDDLLYDASTKTVSVITSRQKTGVHVRVKIQPDVTAEVLSAMLLNKHPDYIFWNTGIGKGESAVHHWQDDLRIVFQAAAVKTGSHRLRHTFAVWCLENGMPMEELSKLLGHKSIRETEKTYSKWVKPRQDRLDALVTAMWDKAI